MHRLLTTSLLSTIKVVHLHSAFLYFAHCYAFENTVLQGSKSTRVMQYFYVSVYRNWTGLNSIFTGFFKSRWNGFHVCNWLSSDISKWMAASLSVKLSPLGLCYLPSVAEFNLVSLVYASFRMSVGLSRENSKLFGMLHVLRLTWRGLKWGEGALGVEFCLCFVTNTVRSARTYIVN